jgi:hypothetical protein
MAKDALKVDCVRLTITTGPATGGKVQANHPQTFTSGQGAMAAIPSNVRILEAWYTVERGLSNISHFSGLDVGVVHEAGDLRKKIVVNPTAAVDPLSPVDVALKIYVLYLEV